VGPVPSPFDCYLANRGLKTLHVRMRQHAENAFAVAKFLEKDDRCVKVIYPGKVLGIDPLIHSINHSSTHTPIYFFIHL